MELYIQDKDFLRPIPSNSDSENIIETYAQPARRDFSRIIYSPSFRRLQGKSQLFPATEGHPFFRNRLTHSLEVSNIAVTIASYLNKRNPELQRMGWKIDYDVVGLAGLAHDLGHPPFGHNGEDALYEEMKGHGGFEGNAQTLRILSTLEHRITSAFRNGSKASYKEQEEKRNGLNLTYRSLASVVKYDKIVGAPSNNSLPGVSDKKGHYKEDSELVRQIKSHVIRNNYRAHESPRLYTIECQIMDLADDIAYSTFDLEDCWAAGFLNPMDFMTLATPDQWMSISKEVNKGLIKRRINEQIDEESILATFMELFSGHFALSADSDYDLNQTVDRTFFAALTYSEGRELQRTSRLRREFCMQLIQRAIEAIDIIPNENDPALSTLVVEPERALQIECLKAFNHEMVIKSQSLKTSEFRGKDIVKTIFQALINDKNLLPRKDLQLIERASSDQASARIVCDFVAGMTDQFAAEFYNKIKGTSPSSVFSQLDYI